MLVGPGTRQTLKGIIHFPASLLERSDVLLRLTRLALGRGRRIVVVGGHQGDTFDDNGRAFALHLRNDPSYRVYWISGTRAVSRRAKAARLMPLRRNWPLAELVLSAAHLICYSHGFGDLSSIGPPTLPGRKALYLGHGVWGLKRIERRVTSESGRQFDLTIAASAAEQQLKSDVLGVPKSRVLLVGLPKHDDLGDPLADEMVERTVLYCPTWRDWLQYKPSDLALESFLSGLKALVQTMPAFDGSGRAFRLVYILHKNLRGIARQVNDASSIHGLTVVHSDRADMNLLLRSSMYLITDYSSLLWDFIIQGRPAARFPFDADVYDKLTGGYTQIARLADRITSSDPAEVWRILFSEEGRAASQRLSKQVVEVADGRACERLEIKIDALLRGLPGALQDSPVPIALPAERSSRTTTGH